MRSTFYTKARLFFAVLFLVGIPANIFAAITVDDIKASQVIQFLGFVDWPASRNYAQQSDITVCVLGDTPVNRSLDALLDSATAKTGKKFHKQTLKGAKSAGGCHALFISDSEADHVDDIISSLAGQPILTFSDMDGFVDHGGMIGFVISDSKVKFAISSKSASDAGFRVKADALELAVKVVR